MLDLIILIILGFGFLIGLKRGFILQIVHLTGFIIAFIIAYLYYDQLAPKLTLWVPFPNFSSDSALSLVMTLSSGAVFAGYQPENDININITLLPKLIQPSGKSGELTFNTQEAAHQSVTKLTGLSINYSYINLNLNGSTILAVDPPAALYNLRR